tara:strand:+ start:236 stop:1123 length:888 start_codon:yes stop_codon:yes gene_type:complete
MKIAKINKKNKSNNKFFLLLASLCFSFMTVCVKKIDERIPIIELVFFRSLLSFAITSYIISKKGINPWGKNKPLLVIRGILGTIALICIFYAIQNMPLSLSTVIQYTYPIFISIFAGLLIKEKITKNIILALLSGWLGILVILNPYQLSISNIDIKSLAILVAFIGSISTSLAYITVKKLSLTEDVFVIIKYFPFVSLITLFPFVVIYWVTPSINELFWIAGIGLFTQIGQILLTIGLKNLPASEASSINYFQVFFGSLWGILFFREIINVNFIFGSLLVLLGTIISSSKMHKNI